MKDLQISIYVYIYNKKSKVFWELGLGRVLQERN